MKSIALLVFIACGTPVANAQIEAHPIDYRNRLEVELEDEKAAQSLADKLATVAIIDARIDSSIIGYYSASTNKVVTSDSKLLDGPVSKRYWPKLYSIKPSLESGIAKWANNYLQLNKEDSIKNNLLIVIKKFWLSHDAALAMLGNDKQGQPNQGFDPGIVTKLEFYLQRDNVYYPLFRVDSTYSFKDKLPDYASNFVSDALVKSFEKLFSINWEDVPAKRKKLSLNDIKTSNKKITELPVLIDTVHQKGAYKNFEEFRMNKPSIASYELRTGQVGDILYVKEKDTEYPDRKAWGYCDGTDFFINSGDKYSKLIRCQSTFYFAGIKGISRKARHDIAYSSALNFATNTGRKHSSFSAIAKYYQLDMETGEVY